MSALFLITGGDEVYYVHPATEQANKTIAEMLGTAAEAAEEREVKCADGSPRNLYRVSKAQLMDLWEMRRRPKFSIYVRVEEGTPPRLCEPEEIFSLPAKSFPGQRKPSEFPEEIDVPSPFV